MSSTASIISGLSVREYEKRRGYYQQTSVTSYNVVEFVQIIRKGIIALAGVVQTQAQTSTTAIAGIKAEMSNGRMYIVLGSAPALPAVPKAKIDQLIAASPVVKPSTAWKQADLAYCYQRALDLGLLDPSVTLCDYALHFRLKHQNAAVWGIYIDKTKAAFDKYSSEVSVQTLMIDVGALQTSLKVRIKEISLLKQDAATNKITFTTQFSALSERVKLLETSAIPKAAYDQRVKSVDHALTTLTTSGNNTRKLATDTERNLAQQVAIISTIQTEQSDLIKKNQLNEQLADCLASGQSLGYIDPNLSLPLFTFMLKQDYDSGKVRGSVHPAFPWMDYPKYINERIFELIRRGEAKVEILNRHIPTIYKRTLDVKAHDLSISQDIAALKTLTSQESAKSNALAGRVKALEDTSVPRASYDQFAKTTAASLESHRSKVDGIESVQGRHETELTSVKADVERVKQLTSTLKSTLEGKAQAAEVAGKIASLEASQSLESRKLSAAETRLTAVENSVLSKTIFEQREKAIQSALTDHQSALDESRREAGQVSKRVTESEIRIKELETLAGVVSTQQPIIEQLHKTFEGHKSQNDDAMRSLQISLEKALSDLHTGEEERVGLRKEVDGLQKTLREKDIALQSLAANMDETVSKAFRDDVERINKLEEEKARLTESLRKETEERSSLSTQVADMQGKMAKMMELFSSTMAQNEELKGLVGHLTAKIDTLEAGKKEGETKIDGLKKELSFVAERMSGLTTLTEARSRRSLDIPSSSFVSTSEPEVKPASSQGRVTLRKKLTSFLK